MTTNRRTGRYRAALGVIVLVCVIVIPAVGWLGAPLIVRHLVIDYLAQAGVDATIEDIDVNPWLGTVVFDGARGANDAGVGFEIGQLLVSIEYAPLLSRRIVLSRFAVADASIDVRRQPDNSLLIGGIPVLDDNGGSSSFSWGVALEQLALAGLRIHYSQPAMNGREPLDRTLVINESDARDLVTWQPENDIPVAADLQIDDSRLRIEGALVPFGKTLKGRLTLVAEKLALDLFSPATDLLGLTRVSGVLDGRQRVEMTFSDDTGLDLDLSGDIAWRSPTIGLTNGPSLDGDLIGWDGTLRAQLMRGANSPATIETDGSARTEALRFERAGGLVVGPLTAEWQGTSTTTIVNDGATRVTADGQLDAETLAVASGGPDLELKPTRWQGRAHLELGAERRLLETDGQFDTEGLSFAQRGAFDLAMQPTEWQGTSRLVLSARRTALDTEGRFDTEGLRMSTGDGLRLDPVRGSWQGRSTIRLGAEPRRIETRGQLDLEAFNLTTPSGLQIGPGRGRWNGTTAYISNEGIRVTVDGALDTPRFELRTAGGLVLAADDTTWQGALDTRIATRQQRLSSDSTLDARRLTIESGLTRAELSRVDWQGRIAGHFARAVALEGSGQLALAGVRADFGPGGQLEIDDIDWDIDFEGDDEQGFDATGNGQLTMDRFRFEQARAFSFGARSITLDGDLGLAATDPLRLIIEGHLSGDPLRISIAKAADFESTLFDWRGRMGFDLGGAGARSVSGRLRLDDAVLAPAGAALDIQAQRLIYDGDYRETPGGHGLVLHMAGDASAQTLAVQNTDIDALWLTVMDLELSQIAVDGIDDIAFGAADGVGLRLLTGLEAAPPVMSAVSVRAKAFQLANRRNYALDVLDIGNANIQIERTSDGLGAISTFFMSDDDTQDTTATSSETRQTAPTTFRLGRGDMAAPAVTFTDTSVTPNVYLRGSAMEFELTSLDTGAPEDDARYDLGLEIGAYGHLDSEGSIAPQAAGGIDMDIQAWIRSLSLPSLSGYLNAALGRRIANGVADGTLELKADGGQLDGVLDTTLANFRLVDTPNGQTEILLGISLDTALDIVRNRNDLIDFRTLILGDVTNPAFSIRNLVREAILAGLRTALTSDFSPFSLITRGARLFGNLFDSLGDRPALFEPGQDYIRPQDRVYLQRIAQAMLEDLDRRLVVTPYVTQADIEAASDGPAEVDSLDANARQALESLGERRARAVHDYLAARDVNPDRIRRADVRIERDSDRSPRAELELDQDQSR